MGLSPEPAEDPSSLRSFGMTLSSVLRKLTWVENRVIPNKVA